MYANTDAFPNFAETSNSRKYVCVRKLLLTVELPKKHVSEREGEGRGTCDEWHPMTDEPPIH